MTVTHNENGDRLLFSDDMQFDIKKSEDSLAHIHIRKDADGSSFANARERAAKIDYSYRIDGKTIFLDDYLTTDIKNKVRDQEVTVTIYVPSGTEIQFDESAKHHIGRSTKYDKDLYRSEVVDYRWSMKDNGELHCLDCPDEMDNNSTDDEKGRIIINEDGVDIDLQDKSDSFQMKINEDGVKIKARENN
jgi:hypothetical protein